LLRAAAPDAEQQQDLDFRLVLGQLFTLLAYAQLILEQAKLTGLDPDVLDTIFEVFIRDSSALAVELHARRPPPRPNSSAHWPTYANRSSTLAGSSGCGSRSRRSPAPT
jgi:hypothetical protein